MGPTSARAGTDGQRKLNSSTSAKYKIPVLIMRLLREALAMTLRKRRLLCFEPRNAY